MWCAMTSPSFDFQDDPLQQGEALIIGLGDQHIWNQVIIKNNTLSQNSGQISLYFKTMDRTTHINI